MMDCLEGIYTRRSIRNFTDKPVKEEDIKAIMQAAISAPSPHNEQPWDFLIITEKRLIERLASTLKEEYVKSGKADIEKAERTRKIISSAQVIIIGLLNIKKLKKENELERIMGIQSLAAVAENILVAANCIGLGAHWRAVPLVRPDIFKKMFILPDHVEPQWMILLGHTASVPKPKSVIKEGIFHFNKWV